MIGEITMHQIKLEDIEKAMAGFIHIIGINNQCRLEILH